MTATPTKCSDATIAPLLPLLRSHGVKAQQLADDADCGRIVNAGLEHADVTHDFFEKLAGRAVPWALDDFNPKTKEDADVRRRISQFVELAKRRLRQQGLKETDDTFKERLAIALYLFAQAPLKGELQKLYDSRPDLALPIFSWFNPLGLSSLREDIEKEGGLGLALFAGDANPEATALETLKQKLGRCTERSKVLYAVMKQAGLDPVFIHMGAKDVRKAWFSRYGTDRPMPAEADDYTAGHVAVALSLKGKYRYFEPNTIDADAPYNDGANTITLQEMYQIDLTNLAMSGAYPTDAAGRAVAGAFALGASTMTAHIHLSNASVAAAKEKSASFNRHLEAALQVDPHLVSAHHYVCMYALSNENWGLVHKSCRELPSDSVQAAIAAAELAQHEGKYDEARKQAEEAMNRGNEPYGTTLIIASFFQKEGRMAEALACAERAIHIDPKNHAAYRMAAGILAGQGKVKEAMGYVQRILSVDPSDPATLFEASRILAEGGHVEMARQYFRRCILSLYLTKQMSYADSKDIASVTEKLGEWKLVASMIEPIAFAKGNDVDPALAPMSLVVEAQSHANVDFARNNFLALLVGLLKAFRRDYPFEELNPQTGMIEYHPGVSTLPEVPAEVYWRLAAIAKNIGSMDKLELFVHEAVFVPEYAVYALHTSWARKDGVESKRDLVAWTEYLDTVATISFSSWTTAKLVHLNKIAKAIEELPQEMTSDASYRATFARLFEILGLANEFLGQPGGALEAYRKAIQHGAEDNIRKRVLFLEEKLLPSRKNK